MVKHSHGLTRLLAAVAAADLGEHPVPYSPISQLASILNTMSVVVQAAGALRAALPAAQLRVLAGMLGRVHCCTTEQLLRLPPTADQEFRMALVMAAQALAQCSNHTVLIAQLVEHTALAGWLLEGAAAPPALVRAACAAARHLVPDATADTPPGASAPGCHVAARLWCCCC